MTFMSKDVILNSFQDPLLRVQGVRVEEWIPAFAGMTRWKVSWPQSVPVKARG